MILYRMVLKIIVRLFTGSLFFRHLSHQSFAWIINDDREWEVVSIELIWIILFD